MEFGDFDENQNYELMNPLSHMTDDVEDINIEVLHREFNISDDDLFDSRPTKVYDDKEVAMTDLPDHEYSNIIFEPKVIALPNDQQYTSEFINADFNPLWGTGVSNEVPKEQFSPAWDIRNPVEEVVIDFVASPNSICDLSREMETAKDIMNQSVGSPVRLSNMKRETKQNLNQSATARYETPVETPAKQSRGRGRPRVAPEVHLSKITSKISKKQKKTLNNNAASCRYRHKKISEQQLANAMLQKEEERGAALMEKSKKLQEDIEKLRMIVMIL